MSSKKQGDPWDGFLAFMVIALSVMYFVEVVFR